MTVAQIQDVQIAEEGAMILVIAVVQTVILEMMGVMES